MTRRAFPVPTLPLLFGVLSLHLGVTGPAAAETGTDLRSLFPRKAPVECAGDGLCRLAPPAELLTACQADLSDLRIFDQGGRELPFLVDSVKRSSDELEVVRRLPLSVDRITRSEERPVDAPRRFVEEYRINLPPLPAGSASWDVVVNPNLSTFVAALEVSVVEPDGSASALRNTDALFRLERPAAERTRFPVGADARRVVVRLTSSEGAFLQPEFRLEARRLLPSHSIAEVPLRTSSQRSIDGTTVLVLHRPRGLLPSRLRLHSSTGSFHREVTVWDVGPGAHDTPLARATLFRIAAAMPVEQLDLQLAPARGDRLRLQITDRDSPPLEELRVAALIERPLLYFSMPDGQEHATIYFGGARAHGARYDLDSLLPPTRLPIDGSQAERALPFLDPAQSRLCRFGPSTANPLFDPQPALAFAMRPGARLADASSYRSRRDLQVPDAAEGLTRLQLEAADLSQLRDDLADLRVVDPEGRQWAFLLERESGASDLELSVTREIEGRDAVYELRLPYPDLAVTRLDLEFREGFFDRPFVLEARHGGDDLELATGRLSRHRGDQRAASLDLRTVRCDALLLSVHNGDDAPLELVAASARVPRAEIFLAAPAGPYALLLGNPRAARPDYELERVRSTVLALPAAAISAGPLAANPHFSAGARLLGSAGLQQLVMWAVLGLAVVILVFFTLRLARQEPGD